MAFDRKHYNEMKRRAAYSLRHVSCLVPDPCPVEHAKTQLHLIAFCVAQEDYEGAKAIKDAVREFFNEYWPDGNIQADELLNLPAYNPELIFCHISYARK
jgi:hypothetical protein